MSESEAFSKTDVQRNAQQIHDVATENNVLEEVNQYLDANPSLSSDRNALAYLSLELEKEGLLPELLIEELVANGQSPQSITRETLLELSHSDDPMSQAVATVMLQQFDVWDAADASRDGSINLASAEIALEPTIATQIEILDITWNESEVETGFGEEAANALSLLLASPEVRIAHALTVNNGALFTLLDTIRYGGEPDKLIGIDDLNEMIRRATENPNSPEAQALTESGLTESDLRWMSQNWNEPAVQNLRDAELDNLITLDSLQLGSGFNALDDSYVRRDNENRVAEIHYPNGSYREFSYDDNGQVMSSTVFDLGQEPQVETLPSDSLVTADGDLIIINGAESTIHNSDGSTSSYATIVVEPSGARLCYDDSIPPRLLNILHPDGSVSCLDYSADGTLLQVNVPGSLNGSNETGEGSLTLRRAADGQWQVLGDSAQGVTDVQVTTQGSIIATTNNDNGTWITTFQANGTTITADSRGGVNTAHYTDGSRFEGMYLYNSSGDVVAYNPSVDVAGNVSYSFTDPETNQIMRTRRGSDGWTVTECSNGTTQLVTAITYCDGSSVSLTYQNNEVLTEVNFSDGTRLSMQADGSWTDSTGRIYATAPIVTPDGQLLLSYQSPEPAHAGEYTVLYRNLDGTTTSATSIEQFGPATITERASAIHAALTDGTDVETAVFALENMSLIDRLRLDQEYVHNYGVHIADDIRTVWGSNYERIDGLMFHGRDGGSNDAGYIAMALSLCNTGNSERGERELRLILSVMTSEQIASLEVEYYNRYNVRLVDAIMSNPYIAQSVKETVAVYLDGTNQNFQAVEAGNPQDTDVRLSDRAFNALVDAALNEDNEELSMELFSEVMTQASEEQRATFMADGGLERMQGAFDGEELTFASDYAENGRINLMRLIDGNMATLHRNRDALNLSLINATDEERDLYRRGGEVIEQWRMVEGLTQSEIDERIRQLRIGADVSFTLGVGASDSILFYSDVHSALVAEAQRDWEVPFWEFLLLHPERNGGLVAQLRTMEESNCALIDIGGNIISGTHHNRDQVMETISFMSEDDWRLLKTDPEYRAQFNQFLSTWLTGDELLQANSIVNELLSFDSYESVIASRSAYERALYLSTTHASKLDVIAAVEVTMESAEFKGIVERINNGTATAEDEQKMSTLIEVARQAFEMSYVFTSYQDVATSENPLMQPLFAPQDGESRLSVEAQVYLAETDLQHFNVILQLADTDKERLIRGMSDGASEEDVAFAELLLSNFSADERQFISNYISHEPPRDIDIARGFVLGLLTSDPQNSQTVLVTEVSMPPIDQSNPNQVGTYISMVPTYDPSLPSTTNVSAPAPVVPSTTDGLIINVPVPSAAGSTTGNAAPTASIAAPQTTDISVVLAGMLPEDRVAFFEEYAREYGADLRTDILNVAPSERVAEFQYLLATNDIEARDLYFDMLHQVVMSMDSGADDLMQGFGWDETTTQVQQELLDFVDAMAAASAQGRELTQEETIALGRDLDEALSAYVTSKGEFSQAFIETVITIGVMAASMGTATSLAFVLAAGGGSALFKAGASAYLMGNDYDGNVGRDLFTGFLSGALNSLGPDIFGPMPETMPFWRRVASEYMRNSLLGVGAGGTSGFFYGAMNWNPELSFAENIQMVMNSTTLGATFGGVGAIVFTTGTNGLKAIGYVTYQAGRQVFTAVRNMHMTVPSPDGGPPANVEIHIGDEVPVEQLDTATFTDSTTGEPLNPTHVDSIPEGAMYEAPSTKGSREPSAAEKTRLGDLYTNGTDAAIAAFADEARPALDLLERTRQIWREAQNRFNAEFDDLNVLRRAAEPEFNQARREILALQIDRQQNPELAGILDMVRDSGEINFDLNRLKEFGATDAQISSWTRAVDTYNDIVNQLTQLIDNKESAETQMNQIITDLINDFNARRDVGLPPVTVEIVDPSVVGNMGGDYADGHIRINRDRLRDGADILAGLIFHENVHNSQDALVVWNFLSEIRADGRTPTAADVQDLWRSEIGTMPPPEQYINDVMAIHGDEQIPADLIPQAERLMEGERNYVSPRATNAARQFVSDLIGALRTQSFDDFMASNHGLLDGDAAYDRRVFGLSGAETLADIADPATNNWAQRLLDLRERYQNNPDAMTGEEAMTELSAIMNEARRFVRERNELAQAQYMNNPREVDAYGLGYWMEAEIFDPYRASRSVDSSGEGYYHQNSSGQLDDVIIQGVPHPERYVFEDGQWYRILNKERQSFAGEFNLTPEGQLIIVTRNADNSIVIKDALQRPIQIDTPDNRHFTYEYDPSDPQRVIRITENSRAYESGGRFVELEGSPTIYTAGPGDTVIRTNSDGSTVVLQGRLGNIDGMPVVISDNGTNIVFRDFEGRVRRYEGEEGNYAVTYENGRPIRVVREAAPLEDPIVFAFDQTTGNWTAQVGDQGIDTVPGIAFDRQGRPVVEVTSSSGDTLQFIANETASLSSVIRSDGLIFEKIDGVWSWRLGDRTGTLDGQVVVIDQTPVIEVETESGLEYTDLFNQSIDIADD